MIASPISFEAQSYLNRFYLREMAGAGTAIDNPINYREYPAIYSIENQWISLERARCDVANLPDDVSSFETWYHLLHRKHRSSVAPFFHHLARTATLEEVAFYICMEGQVDGRFDDVIALAQVGLTGDEKMALAENYWDEMGQGDPGLVHTTMFAESADYMANALSAAGIDITGCISESALKNGNIILLMALRRNYVPMLIGALSILEHTAPWRFHCTTAGLRRLNVPAYAIEYHDMHIAIDAKHGNDLIRRVIRPILSRRPELCREVAYGCAIRFNIAQEYYDGIISTMRRMGICTLPSQGLSNASIADFEMSESLELNVSVNSSRHDNEGGELMVENKR